MTLRRRIFRIDKLRLGIAFFLSLVSYSIANKLMIRSKGLTLWKWLSSTDALQENILLVPLAWLLSFFVPIIFWYVLLRFFFRSGE